MATSGSITTKTCEGRSLTLSWTLSSQSVSGNYSNISWKLKGSGSGSGWVYAGNFKAVINGSTVYSSSTRIKLYNGTTVASGTAKITHNSDGTKSFKLSCEAGIYTIAVNCSASGTHTLTTIPRASSVSASSVTMENKTTISISRASSSFTHTLTYKFGSTTGTIVTKTSSTSVSWTPSISLANQIPNAVTGTCTITCDTYNGSTKIGTKTCTMTLTVPSSAKPTIESLIAERVDGDVPSTWGIYVQSKSRAKLTINGAAGIYGSTISSYSISGGGFSGTVSSLTTGVLNSSGTITFKAKVTDSRGRTSDEATVSIVVVSYVPPSFEKYQSQRALSNGEASNDGNYVKGLVSYSFASCSGKNTLTRSVFYKKSKDSTWINANAAFSSNAYFVFGNGNISKEFSYDIKYVISDAFNTISVIDLITTASVVMDFKVGGKGVAIGKVSEFENTFDISDEWELMVHGKKLADYIYPVGSIYLSTNSINPTSIFGGTWIQIKDRFLLGAGDTYHGGETGGEAAHKLTTSELPSHTHSFSATTSSNGSHTHSMGKRWSDGSGSGSAYTYHSSRNVITRSTESAGAHTHSVSGTTAASGSGAAHNNMPPYITVFIWKRTA